MRKFSSLLVGVLLAVAVAGPAQAADPANVYNKVAQTADPQAAAAKLSKADRKALMDYLTPVKTVETEIEPKADLAQAMQLAASGCQEVGHVVARYNAFGQQLWAWTMYAEVCWNGLTITYSYVRNYGVTNVIFWSWRLVDQHKQINVFSVPQKVTAFGQAEFKVCLFGDIGCTNYYYPWNELRFYANGTHSWRWGQ